jgi:plasmid stabilization system protein ParE
VIELRVSESAALAIIEQADYYREAQGNTLADLWETAVDDAVHSLFTMPERGALGHFRSPSLTGLRWIFIPGFPKHMIFYRYDSEEEVLMIAHVLHGSRDLEAVLNDEP